MKTQIESTGTRRNAAAAPDPDTCAAADVLAAAGARLDLPQPAKSRILLELASDLEDLQAAYREQGLSSDAAMRRTVETCDLSDEALTELMRIHQSW